MLAIVCGVGTLAMEYTTRRWIIPLSGKRRGPPQSAGERPTCAADGGVGAAMRGDDDSENRTEGLLLLPVEETENLRSGDLAGVTWG